MSVKKRRRELTLLSLQQLTKMSTTRLLAYKRKVNSHAFAAPEDGFGDCGCSSCKEIIEGRKLWEIILKNIKRVLKTREHIVRKNVSNH
jgi:hypothetical protein